MENEFDDLPDLIDTETASSCQIEDWMAFLEEREKRMVENRSTAASAAMKRRWQENLDWIVIQTIKLKALAKLPRTEKQLEAVRKTIHFAIAKAIKLPRTEKQLENSRRAVRLAVVASAKKPPTEKQRENGRKHIHFATAAAAKNPKKQKGTWIYKGNEAKFVPVKELEKYLVSGFLKGRGNVLLRDEKGRLTGLKAA